MGGLSPMHWLLVIAVILLLFGSGKVSTLMGDVAKGIKSFKKNMAEDHDVSMAADADRLPPPAAPMSAAERETTTASRH